MAKLRFEYVQYLTHIETIQASWSVAISVVDHSEKL
jgi:hypothetical protein